MKGRNERALEVGGGKRVNQSGSWSERWIFSLAVVVRKNCWQWLEVALALALALAKEIHPR